MLGENRRTNRSRTKSRKRAPRIGGFFHRGPMDTFNAFRQKCSQEDRDAGWSCTKRVARGATVGETVSTRNFGGDLDSRRREDPRTSQRPTGYGDDTSSSPRATDGRLACEAAVGECGQVHYTWAHQEAQQIEIPSVNSWTKGSTAGRGVRKFCRGYAAENTSACSVVSATQIRSTPSIQPQIGGTQCLKQEMSQTSASMLGETTMPAKHSRHSECGKANQGSQCCHQLRRIGGDGRLDIRHGRGRCRGQSAQGLLHERITQAAKNLQRINTTDQSSPATPQPQDTKGPRDEAEGMS